MDSTKWLHKTLGVVLKVEKNRNIFIKKLIDIYGVKLTPELRVACIEIATHICNGTGVKESYKILNERKIGIFSDAFSILRTIQEEEDEFASNPPAVEEGVHTCNCGSQRTLSFTLQVNSGDEATAVWVRCVECNNTWRV